MTSQLTFKKILSLLHEIILFILSIFLVIWLIALPFFIPIIGTTTLIMLNLKTDTKIFMEFVPLWYWQLTIITLGGGFLFVYLPSSVRFIKKYVLYFSEYIKKPPFHKGT